MGERVMLHRCRHRSGAGLPVPAKRPPQAGHFCGALRPPPVQPLLPPEEGWDEGIFQRNPTPLSPQSLWLKVGPAERQAL